MSEGINWGSVSVQSGQGNRRYGGPPPAIGEWKCPKCASPNTGPVEQGCTACGAGKPGYVVAEQQGGPDPVVTAFLIWKQTSTNPTDLLEAFRAGIEYAMKQSPKQESGGSGLGATQRTIVAALAFFIEQVLVQNPEEVKSGEWLSATEARKYMESLNG